MIIMLKIALLKNVVHQRYYWVTLFHLLFSGRKQNTNKKKPKKNNNK